MFHFFGMEHYLLIKKQKKKKYIYIYIYVIVFIKSYMQLSVLINNIYHFGTYWIGGDFHSGMRINELELLEGKFNSEITKLQQILVMVSLFFPLLFFLIFYWFANFCFLTGLFFNRYSTTFSGTTPLKIMIPSIWCCFLCGQRNTCTEHYALTSFISHLHSLS